MRQQEKGEMAKRTSIFHQKPLNFNVRFISFTSRLEPLVANGRLMENFHFEVMIVDSRKEVHKKRPADSEWIKMLNDDFPESIKSGKVSLE